MVRERDAGVSAPPRYWRPTVADLDAVLRVHGDPRTHVFNPDDRAAQAPDLETVLNSTPAIIFTSS